MNETANANNEKQTPKISEKNKRRTRILAYALIILNILIAIVTNIATNAIPASITPYLKFSWFALGILVVIYIFIEAKFNSDQQHNSSVQSKRLAQRAIREAKDSLFRNEKDGIFFQLISLPHYINSVRHKQDLRKRVLKFEQIAENYSMAIQEIDNLVADDKLPSNIATLAKNNLSQEFLIFGEHLSSHSPKVNNESD